MHKLPSNLARSLLVTLPLIATLSACPPEVPAEEAALFFSARGFNLPADGATTLDVVLTARDELGEADNSIITVNVDSGTLSLAEGENGTVADDGLSLSATPTNGLVRYSFLCVTDVQSTVAMSAANGTVTRTQNLSCLAPQGTIEVRLDDSDCNVNRLVADGESSCEVIASVVLQSPSGAFPRQGVALTATVTDATAAATSPLPASDVVLSGNGDNNNLSRLLSLATDENGEVSIFLHSPELTLEESITVEVTGVDSSNNPLTPVTVTKVIAPFNNQSSISITAGQNSVIGGSTTTLIVQALDQDGDQAAGDTVVLALTDDSDVATLSGGAGGDAGVTTGDTISVTLDETGRGEVDLTTEEVLDVASVSVTATYQPVEVLPALTDSVVIDINPAGALIVNAVAAPNEIRSDLNETTTVTVTVEKEGNALENASVRFVVPTGDTERIGFGVVPALVSTFDATTNVDGIASVEVSPTSDRVRGPATVQVTVTDDDPESADVVKTVTFSIDRLPILQSVVFISATPAIIGVRGSSTSSSSVLSFQVFDDTSLPMPGVPVAFDVNATADPGASVTGTEISDGAGLVSVVLAAGTQAGPITVVARAVSGNVALTVESAPIAVVGGLPTFSQSYLLCTADDSVSDLPFQNGCTAVVADRFTARSGLTQTLQFRAEGGNITPAATTTDGVVEVFFSTGEPGFVNADATGWSYGAALPIDTDLDTTLDTNGDGATFTAATCFDGNSQTPCDLLQLCADAEAPSNNDIFCPLPAGPAAGCWDRLTAEDLDTIYNPPTTVEYVTDVNGAQAKVASVMTKNDVCGFPIACLVGKSQLFPFVSGDECNVARGCFDFDGTTPCPQSGLVTLMASTRGEESFVDLNGNGVFDFVDDDEDGQHDPDELALEPWVDMPEPFLDKNGSCSRDDFAGSFRLTDFQEVLNTDPFSDEDLSGDFGYIDPNDPTGPRLLTNGRFDRDKEIFFTTHAVRLSGFTGQDGFVAGEVCTTPGQNITCTNGAQQLCREYSPQLSLAVGCVQDPDFVFPDESTIKVGFGYVDANGNCMDRGREVIVEATQFGVVLNPGATTTTGLTCGIGDQGEGVRNPLKPWCEEYPNLGGGNAALDIRFQCPIGTQGLQPAGVSFSYNGSGVTTSNGTNFNVQCPICGDTVVEGWETCEPGDTPPAGQICEECQLVPDP